jgi:sulfatase maturation enzyme AslB (radical SAM superfamily)
MHPEGLALVSSRGEPRGFVDPLAVEGRLALEDLWVMQGSLCDLRCKHCYTASSPVNGRLQQIRPDELKPHLEEAARYGVHKIYFTGGEPFVNEDVLRGRAAVNEDLLQNLENALPIAPVEILTNGRRYLRHHLHALGALARRYPGKLTLRITIESPRATEHDAIRGRGAFAKTIETIRLLGGAGFVPVITAERPQLREQTNEEIREAYAALFPSMRIEVNLIENMLEMGHELARMADSGVTPRPATFITTNCFQVLNKPPETLMCHFSRCIQKIEGALHYYPCPVIYDDPCFDLGRTLTESLRRVYVAHKNCYDYCLKGRGASCRTSPIR